MARFSSPRRLFGDGNCSTACGRPPSVAAAMNDLSSLRTVDDVRQVLAAVLAAVARGEIAPAAAARIGRRVRAQSRAVRHLARVGRVKSGGSNLAGRSSTTGTTRLANQTIVYKQRVRHLDLPAGNRETSGSVDGRVMSPPRRAFWEGVLAGFGFCIASKKPGNRRCGGCEADGEIRLYPAPAGRPRASVPSQI
jgi:hypothetical protein